MTDEQKNNNNCIFPKCPICNEGYLVPFSFKEDVFEKWKCTECGHTIKKHD
ncbi:MAG: hypothetical protein IIA87_00895 [Nanoarchaeota archaeon]|nr:hypothetical protein [Nanoarchaeota archaeon]